MSNLPLIYFIINRRLFGRLKKNTFDWKRVLLTRVDFKFTHLPKMFTSRFTHSSYHRAIDTNMPAAMLAPDLLSTASVHLFITHTEVFVTGNHWLYRHMCRYTLFHSLNLLCCDSLFALPVAYLSYGRCHRDREQM